MSRLLHSFRPVLKFSKLKTIMQKNNFHAATIVSNGINDKGKEYDKMFFHTPQCFPNLKDEEEAYYDKIIAEEEKETRWTCSVLVLEKKNFVFFS